MKFCRSLIIFICLGIFTHFFHQSPLISQQKYLLDADIKKKLMTDHKIRKDWKELSIIRSFPTKEDESQIHYLNYPIDSTFFNSEILFIGDLGSSKIIKLSKSGEFLEEFGRSGQGPGEIARLGRIYISKQGDLFVVDAGRIQVFDSDGKYKRSFKNIDTINDFVVGNGYIYANCIYSYQDTDENPLIHKYNLMGELVKTFGKRLNIENHNSIDSRTYLTFQNDTLITGFKYHPLLKQFSTEGELINEIRIDLEILKKLEKYNYDKSFTNPSRGVINLPRLIAGIDATENRFYILLHLPRIEILELDKDGKITNIYYNKEITGNKNFSGFHIYEENKAIFFYIIIHSPDIVQAALFKHDKTN